MKILIMGATSAIAKATARLYAETGAELFLIARNEVRLEELVADLDVRGAKISGHLTLDISKTAGHKKALETVLSSLEKIDLALICHGDLPDQAACENSFKVAQKAINVNGLSTISLLTIFADIFKTQGFGSIAVITSVAGDRGRQPNFVYGASKALVSTYLQGLRGALLPHGVHVIDIKPGLVDSPMTAAFEKGPLWSSPELVAKSIVKGVSKKRLVIYTPGYWRLIMMVVVSIPELIFQRLKF
ncbi:MAG TPA: short-chain dehydrogenase [Gammaproteobacteria bacterium]|nr:short-chain dehydrogenase [Gammaproteobacteria bacterium]|tara:strand:- start:794 stop:1528 length:735 start_codon:yes stop_codon:yes gene_type:complete